MNRQSYKASLWISMILVFTMVISACGGNKDASSGSGGSDGAGNGNVTLSFIHWRGEDVAS
ncbi:hypothetical protein JCM10914_3009 [Paenibacillus sp. JCM 10914]|nr:hypothetical protein JCM10914_3009 [Paenibacillus sp. JCM 10914]